MVKLESMDSSESTVRLNWAHPLHPDWGRRGIRTAVMRSRGYPEDETLFVPDCFG